MQLVKDQKDTTIFFSLSFFNYPHHPTFPGPSSRTEHLSWRQFSRLRVPGIRFASSSKDRGDSRDAGSSFSTDFSLGISSLVVKPHRSRFGISSHLSQLVYSIFISEPLFSHIHAGNRSHQLKSNSENSNNYVSDLSRRKKQPPPSCTKALRRHTTEMMI